MNSKGILFLSVFFLLLFQPFIWLISDWLAPLISAPVYESTVGRLEREFSRGVTCGKPDDLCRRYQISWIELADKKAKWALSNRPSGLEKISAGESKIVRLDAVRFVEVCRKLDGARSISVGFYCPGLMDFFANGISASPFLPSASLYIVLLLNLLLLISVYLVFVAIPLSRLTAGFRGGKGLERSQTAAAEITALSSALSSFTEQIKSEQEKSVQALRADMASVLARESEQRVFSELMKDALLAGSFDRASELVLRAVISLLPGFARAAFAVKFSSEGRTLIVSDIGFSAEQKSVVAELQSSDFVLRARRTEETFIISESDVQETEFKRVLRELSCAQCVVLRLFSSNSSVVSLCFLTEKGQSAEGTLQNAIERVREIFAPIGASLEKFEEAQGLSRKDYLTGAGNRFYLQRSLESLKKRSESGSCSEIMMLCFEGDRFRSLLDNYGPRTVERSIIELSRQILLGLENSVRFKKTESRIAFAENFYRVGDCRFLLVLENFSVEKAIGLAEAVNRFVLDRKDWPHGLPSWSVSTAVCPVNLRDYNADDCLELVLLTLDYLRSRDFSSKVMLASEIPPDFMSRSERSVAASSEHFDPLSFLRSLPVDKMTGVLTVSSASGRVFWAYIEDGSLSKARLGKLAGDAAVVEFVLNFKDGTYLLQDLSSLDSAAADELRSLSGAFLLETNVTELLDCAHKIRDDYASVRSRFKDSEMIAHRTVEYRPDQIRQLFFKTGITASKIYSRVCNYVWDLCSGRLSLAEIVESLSDCPEALIWIALDFLLQNKMLKLSRLRVSAHAVSKDRDRNVARVSLSPKMQSYSNEAGDCGTEPKLCSDCQVVDPKSQKFCIHCGSKRVYPVGDD